MSHKGPFKQATPFADLYQRVQWARRTYPNKMPIVILRHWGEEGLGLPLPDKNVFLLVPRNLYVSELIKLVRNHLRIGDDAQTLLLLDGRGRTACVSARVSRIYDQERAEDGFLYMSYASRSHVGSLMDWLMSKFNVWAKTGLNKFPVVPEGVPRLIQLNDIWLVGSICTPSELH